MKFPKFKMLEKINDYEYNDGTIVEGTRVVILNNEYVEDKVDESYIGQSGELLERWCEFGDVVYTVKFDNGVEHFFFFGQIEIDKEYYRRGKINDILDENV